MSLSRAALEVLRARREAIAAGGGAEALAARHAKGQLGARERLQQLFAAGTFQEVGAHVRHDARAFGMSEKDLPADGVITGSGYVGNLQVAAFSQDFTVCAGTLGKAHAGKIVRLMQYALKHGVPLVAFKDSGGARIQEGVEALSGYGEVFYANVLLSGVVPQIAAVLGPCAGGAAYSPALMDFVVMTRRNAQMFITGPEVIKAVTGRSTTLDEIGGADMHASVSGNVHFIAEDDAHAIAIIQRLLSYLPANNTEDPPHHLDADLDLSFDPGMADLLPEQANEPLDVYRVIARLADSGEFFEVHASFARNIVVGFARIGGVVLGIVANQPAVMAGVLDINASDKASRFIRFCNAFNVPLLSLVDVPGFLPGVEQERGAIIRHGAKLLFAYAACTTPKLTVVMRKAYGGAYLAMCSQEMGADVVYAWPSAEIAVMGAEAAVKILHRRQIAQAADKAAVTAELAQAYRDEFASPYVSAARGYVADVIEPGETRAALRLALRKMLAKRERRPAKKHGNIPL